MEANKKEKRFCKLLGTAKKAKEGRSYKCIFYGCGLVYKTYVGLKRHLSRYDHEFYGMNVFVEDRNVFSNSKDAHNKLSFFREGLCKDEKSGECSKVVIDIRELLSSEARDVGDVFRSAFGNGFVRVRGTEHSNVHSFICRIPGCGKCFKSLLAYKYHCETFRHSLKCLIYDYEKESNVHVATEDFCIRFSNIFRIENDFEISGITHYMYDTPDNYFNIKFNANKRERSTKKNTNTVEEDFCSMREMDSSEIEHPKCERPPEKIEKIVLNGQEHIIQDLLVIGKLALKNFNSFVSCCAFVTNIQQDCPFICIALKPEHRPDKLFVFKTCISQILILNKKLEIVDKIELEFGFVREMNVVLNGGILDFIALFNDGRLRFFRFEKGVFGTFDYGLENIITFCYAPVSKVVVATDGFKMYKLQNDKLILSTTDFTFPIISLAARDVKCASKGQNAPEKATAEGPSFFYLDANGKITYCDADFRNKQDIYKLTGVTEIRYVNEVDFIFVVDTFELVTRYIPFGKSKNTHVLCKNGTACTTYFGKSLFLGGFDGTARRCIQKKRSLKIEPILRCLVKNNVLFVYIGEEEIRLSANNEEEVFDYGTSIVNIGFWKETLFIVYRNGITISVEGLAA